jgi:DNA gyrase subunit A
MAKKKPGEPKEHPFVEQLITDTLEQNYMPYAMSVIVSRAIPEIDGFKPSHRKLLYTMYKMGLLTGARTKSANVVGQTMKLNPHGDSAIYETMVRLSKSHEALIHPFIDSKGNFGKHFSRDMAYAASRYTEVKLEPLCAEIFKDLEKDTVDFTDNYDNTLKEPTLLPTTFPNVLVNANQGIAVGMASSICSFNLREVCETAIAYIKNPDHDIMSTLLAPDLSTGGQLIYSQKDIEEIYRTGHGSFRLRSVYGYVPAQNCIEITQIPYTTTVEAIIDKLADYIRLGKIKEISDVRDETDLSGLKITIDLKRGTDPDKLMARLFKMTPLEDAFSCNFNILIAGTPRVMGIREILDEWIAFRLECLKRQLHFDRCRKEEKLHLLRGLEKILLDIDKAVAIVRETDEESEVVPNLMIGFGIDEPQAEFVADIRLRNLNKEYILKRTAEISQLISEISELTATLADRRKQNGLIIETLAAIAKKYGCERKTAIIYQDEVKEYVHEEHIDDYPVNVFLTRGSYFKKITPLSLRMGSEHKLKEGDEIIQSFEAKNKDEILFFTNRCQVYKSHLHEFDDSKASVLGDFLPGKLDMDEGEEAVFAALENPSDGYFLFFFENGKAAKVDPSGYQTKTNRKKLVSAYSDKSPLVAAFRIYEDGEFVLESSAGKVLLINSAMIPAKAKRDTQGVCVMTLKPRVNLQSVAPYTQGRFAKPEIYKVRSLPGAGKVLTEEDRKEQQLSFD